MTPQQFEQHKLPHLTYTLTESKLIPFECSYTDDYGIYNICRRDFYTKSNGKKCYVDTFIKQVKVERYKLKPCSNGFSFVVKNRYINEVLSC